MLRKKINKTLFFVFTSCVFILLLLSITNAQNLNQINTIYDPNIYKTQSIQDSRYVSRLQINQIIQKNDINKFVQFYNHYTKNSFITKIIIKKSLKYNVPINLAFSLAKNESEFNPKAIGKENSNGSCDYGLFQLNNYVYNWSLEDFFNIEKNADAGIKHLSNCIDEMDTVCLSLASYNAGPRKTKNNDIPLSTELHISKILEYEDELNKAFNEYFKDLI